LTVVEEPAPRLVVVPPAPFRLGRWLLLALALAVLVLAVGAVGGAIFHTPSSPKEEDVPFEGGPPPPIEVKEPTTPPEPRKKPPPTPPVVERPKDAANPPRKKPPPPPALREMTRRPVEVVFCIDTTGSMGGLLRTATARIWTLCSQIVRG